MLEAVVGLIKICPTELIKVDLGRGDNPVKVGNGANYLVAVISGEGDARAIAAYRNTGIVGVGCGDARGNAYKLGSECGSTGIINHTAEACGNVPDES